ncbi:helix-turn-helix domain-containing protein [Nocardia cyriacigeorgica]|uniref:helix-turn-helix domain-containing protein n=1 Tax=Nocardia cyriacigeorgica TaxID=135487 RepID=UPI0013D70621|nr:XRE family transcriptional regulator [Nocardia cyriacigeorgica]NEW29751.1 ImmA/IrrE family metallo-endopeptidase [Nocardia cyriacigeorgica]
MSDERVWAEIGERVRESRLAAELSQGELAARVGLERSKVAKIEAGSRQINAVELSRLAAALGMPLGHFLFARPEVISRRTPLVDDTDTQAARMSYRIESALSSWLRDVHDAIEFGMDRPAMRRYKDPVETPDDARAAAQWLRRELDLGLEPIDTMMAVCERAGQLVLVVDLPGEGASLIDDDLAVAVVSRDGDPGRRRATAAHELGHMVLGDEYSSDLGGGIAAARSDREAVIDAFAAELLLPAEAVRQHDTDSALRTVLVGKAARYRTSWTLTIRQAEVAGLIDRQAAAKYRSGPTPTHAEMMQAVGWTPPPDFERVRVPPSYADAVLAAWRDNLITASRAVEMMHGQITAKDLGLEDNEGFVP